MGAAEALGRLGRVEELLALARDESEEDWVRLEAAEALAELRRSEKTVELLSALAWDEWVEGEVRLEAAEALAELGWSEEAAELLLALAWDEAVSALVRADAAVALGRLGRATPEVLAGLRALVEEPGTLERVRWAARKALERLEK